MAAKFSHKHYEALAAFYKYELEIAIEVQKSTASFASHQSIMAEARANTIRGLIRLLSLTLQNDNPKFNVKRFYTACGLEE